MLNLNEYFPNLKRLFLIESMTGQFDSYFYYMLSTGRKIMYRKNYFDFKGIPQEDIIASRAKQLIFCDYVNYDPSLPDIDAYIDHFERRLIDNKIDKQQVEEFICRAHPSKFKHILFNDLTCDNDNIVSYICMPTTIESFCIMVWWFERYYDQDPAVNETVSKQYDAFVERITQYYITGNSNINSDKKATIVDINDLMLNKCLDKFYNLINENGAEINFDEIYNSTIISDMHLWIEEFKKTPGFELLSQTFDNQLSFKSKLSQYKIIRG
jgi:hypothetical protein